MDNVKRFIGRRLGRIQDEGGDTGSKNREREINSRSESREDEDEGGDTMKMKINFRSERGAVTILSSETSQDDSRGADIMCTM